MEKLEIANLILTKIANGVQLKIADRELSISNGSFERLKSFINNIEIMDKDEIIEKIMDYSWLCVISSPINFGIKQDYFNKYVKFIKVGKLYDDYEWDTEALKRSHVESLISLLDYLETYNRLLDEFPKAEPVKSLMNALDISTEELWDIDLAFLYRKMKEKGLIK